MEPPQKKKKKNHLKKYYLETEEAIMGVENLLNLQEKYLQQFFHYYHNFTANNLAIKRKEELSKRIIKLPCEHVDSSK